MVRVALAGGWGQLGHEVLDALIARDKHEILFYKITWDKTDYDDLEFLTESLRGVHAVLSFLAGPVHQRTASAQQDAHINLIDASVRAGVKRFAPSEWASSGLERMPWYAFKQSARDHLSNLNKDKKATLPSLLISQKLETHVNAPGLFTNYLLHPFQSAKHGRVYEQHINFHARRAMHCVIALAVEYEGEWPVDGGTSGSRMSVGEVIALGEKIRGSPFEVTEPKMQDLEAGVVKAPWFPKIDHAAVPEETRGAVRPVLLAGVLRSLAAGASEAGAWETSDTWNRLLPDFEFTQPKDILTQGWATIGAGAERIPVEDY
ncbi:NmrA-like family protein [Colletotrichum sojae]|uniref:NmrA-like family protein n=1 Tax=Colletotrichum sojae TaxID=2175907 RepID=A0A8H6JKV7_9PEZI|nr:NmrA-like family protein [Colletotrichum sojae]